MHRVMYPSFFMLNEIRVKTQVRLLLNASTFYLKRKCILIKTQVRFPSNASAFFRRNSSVLIKSLQLVDI